MTTNFYLPNAIHQVIASRATFTVASYTCKLLFWLYRPHRTALNGSAEPAARRTCGSFRAARLCLRLQFFSLDFTANATSAACTGDDGTTDARKDRHGRKQALQQVGQDTRRQSEALEPVELEPQLRIVPPADGMFLFSAAHLHSTVPNTSQSTRLSIDFRTVHLADLRQQRGAPNLDSACTGTTIGDYLRASDLAHVPNDVAAMYRHALYPTPMLKMA